MKKHFYIFINCFFALGVLAQDPQFTQFYNAPLYLNPAFSGLTQEHRFNAAYRNQWPGINKSYSTYMAAYDYNYERKNLGGGIILMQDVAGVAGLVNTGGSLNLAYNADLSKSVQFRGGLMLGMVQKKMDKGKLIFNDQFITGASVSGDAAQISNVSYADLGGGVLVSSGNIWGGAVVKHLNSPNVSMTGGTDKMPVFYGLHGGYTLILDSAGERLKHTVSFVLNYRHERNSDQLDGAVNYYFRFIHAGIGYRGLPLKTYAPGIPNNESITMMLGAQLPNKNMRIIYSYDYTLSRLGLSYTGGAHEVTLIYESGSMVGKKSNRKSNRGKVRQKF